MNPHIGWPQGIFLTVAFLVLCNNASKNGRPREGHYDLGTAAIAVAFEIVLLAWGGFFA